MNIPFLCVLFAFALCYLTRIPVGIAMKQMGNYDNKNPREQQAQLTGWGKRALGAHQNSFEVTPIFAISVLMAHVAGADPTQVTMLAITFVVSRFLYIYLYIKDLDTLRSPVWGIGLACSMALMILSLIKHAV